MPKFDVAHHLTVYWTLTLPFHPTIPSPSHLQTLTLSVDEDELVHRVKQKVEMKEGIPSHLQRLIHAGKEMHDRDNLVDHGIRHSSTVHMAIGVVGGGSSSGLKDEGGLLEVGNHCQHPGCGICDFLPFTCKGCKQQFCLEHFKRADHSCKAAPATPPPNAAWWSPDVVAPAVAPAGKPKKKSKRCVECRKKQVIPMRCNDCGACVCPSHRFGPDHRCAERRVKNQLTLQGHGPSETVCPATDAEPASESDQLRYAGAPAGE